MAIQDRIAQIALSKQTALASPAASGTYQIGVSSGAVASLELSEDAFDMSWDQRLAEGHDRGEATPGSAFDTLAMPKSLGLMLLAALGSDTVTGAGPYTHKFTHANVLPYLTVFARKDTEYFKVSDARMNELELAWEGTKAVTVKTSLVGCQYEFKGSTAYGAATDERPASGVLKGAGGTFTVDGANAIIKGGSIKVANGVNAVFGSDSPTPKDVFPEMVKVSVSLTIVPADTTLFRKVVTGSTSGSSVQALPKYGTVVCSFTDGTNTLTFNGLNVKFLTSFPDTKASGGPVEVTLEGDCAVPAGGGEAFNLTLVNTVASY